MKINEWWMKINEFWSKNVEFSSIFDSLPIVMVLFFYLKAECVRIRSKKEVFLKIKSE
jgi:hypothetical protein